MPLAEVKAIGRSLGAATVNDVVMTAVAGGLARYGSGSWGGGRGEEGCSVQEAVF